MIFSRSMEHVVHLVGAHCAMYVWTLSCEDVFYSAPSGTVTAIFRPDEMIVLPLDFDRYSIHFPPVSSMKFRRSVDPRSTGRAECEGRHQILLWGVPFKKSR